MQGFFKKKSVKAIFLKGYLTRFLKFAFSVSTFSLF